MKLFSIEGCQRKVYARGWCNSHYLRWFKHGSPSAGGTAQGEPERYYREVVVPFAETAPCLPWPYGKTGKGYGWLKMGGHSGLVSRFACEARCGPAPSEAHEAAHSCGNGHEGCVNPHHLRWATVQENASDRYGHGRAKLSPEDVAQILALKGVEKQADIASRFGVHFSLISRIHSRERHCSKMALDFGTETK